MSLLSKLFFYRWTNILLESLAEACSKLHEYPDNHEFQTLPVARVLRHLVITQTVQKLRLFTKD